ncbi:MAG: pyruvate kinase [Patescibacteria group bacterium]
MKNSNSKAQIIATIGPASSKMETLRAMVLHQLDVVRLNFSWSDINTRIAQIILIRDLEKEFNKKIPIIVDLPGPRIKKDDGHTYDNRAISSITEHDEEFIKFAVENNIDYVAVSFVAGPEDIEKCRKVINDFGGKQKIIAKIERAVALEFIHQIVEKADAVMIARGDLGNDVAIEKIPFIQDKIIKISKSLGKSVIVATQMLLSMVENKIPTRAEVTDVANAILQGSDAVMLSEETAKGKYPVDAVAMMERIVIEAEKHMDKKAHLNPL